LPEEDNKKSSPVERLVFWVGSILGIAVAAFTMYDSLTKASPPDLHVALAIGGGNTFRVAPLIKDEGDSWTKFFPIGVVVANRGETTARDVILRWVSPTNFRIESSSATLPIERNVIVSGNSQKILSTLHLGQIHPNQEIRLDDAIFASAENTTRIVVNAESADKVPIRATFAITVTYEVEARVSAQDISEKSVPFYITVGPKDQLEKLGKPYWEATEDGVKLLVPKPKQETVNPGAAPDDNRASRDRLR
jgi:hypothetical protein